MLLDLESESLKRWWEQKLNKDMKAEKRARAKRVGRRGDGSARDKASDVECVMYEYENEAIQRTIRSVCCVRTYLTEV